MYTFFTCGCNLLVSLSVKAFVDILSIVTAHEMLADYYSTCIQLFPTSFSLQHFHTWLLSCLQLVSSDSNVTLHNTAVLQVVNSGTFLICKSAVHA